MHFFTPPKEQSVLQAMVLRPWFPFPVRFFDAPKVARRHDTFSDEGGRP